MNFAIIEGQTANLTLTGPPTPLQLDLTTTVDSLGITVAANQFTVSREGRYLVQGDFYPKSPLAAAVGTVQIFNATTAVVVASCPLPSNLEENGLPSKPVSLSFEVTNIAHQFQLRILVPDDVRSPNSYVLASPIGNAIFRLVIQAAIGSEGSFGDGSDGDLDFDGVAAVLGLAPVAGVYTLIRDIYAGDCLVQAAASIVTAGFKIYAQGVLTVEAGATVGRNGNDGVAGVGGGAAGAALAAGTVHGSAGAGGAGNVAAGAAGTAATASIGGAGGAGATQGGNAGGAGGAATVPTAVQGGANVPRAMPYCITGGLAGAAVATLYQGGGGGGGGAGDGANSGGGGGSGGGVVLIAAALFAGDGTIEANGGAGGAGDTAGGSSGGGGGGGGGLVITTSQNPMPATLTVQALGGAPGAAGGGGAAGTVGAVGTVIHVVSS